MPKRHSMPSPEDAMLFNAPELLTAEQLDVGAMATQIAANADAHPADTNKPLPPVMEDLGWRRRDTLAADPPYPPSSHQRARRSRSAISKAAIGPRRGEEEGVGYPNNEPFYYQHPDPLTQEELKRNVGGRAAVRAAVAKTLHPEQ